MPLPGLVNLQPVREDTESPFNSSDVHLLIYSLLFLVMQHSQFMLLMTLKWSVLLLLLLLLEDQDVKLIPCWK